MTINLMYHNVKPTQELVVSDYDISLEDLELDIKCVQDSDNKDVNFTFDDGQDGSFLAAELLSRYQMRGIFFIISDKIGSKGFLNEVEVRKIHQMGHTIGSHSHTHPMFNELPDNEVIFELQKSKDILENITSSVVASFAFPGGKRKRHHSLIARDMGFEEVFNSFERYARQTQIEKPRFHVRQSTRNCVSKIIKLNKGYLLQRYLRSILVEIKGAVK